MESADQKKTRVKLKKFLTRRPTLQAVRDKGYIKGSSRIYAFVKCLHRLVGTCFYPEEMNEGHVPLYSSFSFAVFH